MRACRAMSCLCLGKPHKCPGASGRGISRGAGFAFSRLWESPSESFGGQHFALPEPRMAVCRPMRFLARHRRQILVDSAKLLVFIPRLTTIARLLLQVSSNSPEFGGTRVKTGLASTLVEIDLHSQIGKSAQHWSTTSKPHQLHTRVDTSDEFEPELG